MRMPFIVRMTRNSDLTPIHRESDETTAADARPWSVPTDIVYYGADGRTKYSKAQGETTDDA